MTSTKFALGLIAKTTSGSLAGDPKSSSTRFPTSMVIGFMRTVSGRNNDMVEGSFEAVHNLTLLEVVSA